MLGSSQTEDLDHGSTNRRLRIDVSYDSPPPQHPSHGPPRPVLEPLSVSLGLLGFDDAKPRVTQYLDGQPTCRTNALSLSDRVRERVEKDGATDSTSWGDPQDPTEA